MVGHSFNSSVIIIWAALHFGLILSICLLNCRLVYPCMRTYMEFMRKQIWSARAYDLAKNAVRQAFKRVNPSATTYTKRRIMLQLFKEKQPWMYWFPVLYIISVTRQQWPLHVYSPPFIPSSTELCVKQTTNTTFHTIHMWSLFHQTPVLQVPRLGVYK
jgi:hypothetical protein